MRGDDDGVVAGGGDAFGLAVGFARGGREGGLFGVDGAEGVVPADAEDLVLGRCWDDARNVVGVTFALDDFAKTRGSVP